jgi:hypothetical protein
LTATTSATYAACFTSRLINQCALLCLLLLLFLLLLTSNTRHGFVLIFSFRFILDVVQIKLHLLLLTLNYLQSTLLHQGVIHHSLSLAILPLNLALSGGHLPASNWQLVAKIPWVTKKMDIRNWGNP